MSDRIYVHCGGVTYTIAGREPEEVEQEIASALESGKPHWLDANFGEGRPTRARILITPGVPLAIYHDVESSAADA